jgi:hypothetical protein
VTKPKLIPVRYRTPNESHDREEGDRDARPEEEGDRRPTLYLILDPDQDPSSSSEVRMLVGKKEEVCGKTGAVIHSKRGRERSTERFFTAQRRGSAITAQTLPKGEVSD